MTTIALTNNADDIYGVVVTDDSSEVYKIIKDVKNKDGWSLDDVMVALAECKYVLDIIDIDDYVTI